MPHWRQIGRSNIVRTPYQRPPRTMKNIAILFSALMLTWALPAWAEVSRDDAAAMVQKASGGRVLAVEKAEREGRPVWRVKVLTPQGEVKVVLINAASGAGQ